MPTIKLRPTEAPPPNTGALAGAKAPLIAFHGEAEGDVDVVCGVVGCGVTLIQSAQSSTQFQNMYFQCPACHGWGFIGIPTN